MIAAGRAAAVLFFPADEKLLVGVPGHQGSGNEDSDSRCAGVFGESRDEARAAADDDGIFQPGDVLHLSREEIDFGLKQGHVGDIRLVNGDFRQDRRHIGIALVDSAFEDNFPAQLRKGIGDDAGQPFGIGIAVMHGRQLAGSKRSYREFRIAHALDQAIVAGAEVARQVRAAACDIFVGQAWGGI